MVDLVNSVNNNMTVQKPRIGVITPPDRHSKAGFYNDAEASQRFKDITRELSNADRKVEYHDKNKTWKGILVCTGIVAAGLILMQKNVFAKIKNSNFKDIFKRNPKI